MMNIEWVHGSFWKIPSIELMLRLLLELLQQQNLHTVSTDIPFAANFCGLIDLNSNKNVVHHGGSIPSINKTPRLGVAQLNLSRSSLTLAPIQ